MDDDLKIPVDLSIKIEYFFIRDDGFRMQVSALRFLIAKKNLQYCHLNRIAKLEIVEHVPPPGAIPTTPAAHVERREKGNLN